MTNEEKISKLVLVMDKVEKFVSAKMPGSALFSPELKFIRNEIKDLKSSCNLS
ncbi:hypothetical protein LEP1GSC203_3883 [Leptospira terpstrae serovar Hualin str. LT 11-33 = ATCC 700639]|uniref:Uncharacterized protein n=1 Tax=Leptospira terpstrae serovar Hualin str. LT 11-33 = ATCC 700639 TaxID=1257025 RepID=N1VZ79_9LEPT|nr:hypothetical protein LEP1GSC203_3883 [Leptospira terpstrae serovar Hualin str. LT 11-33 = ATCC 700639]